MLPPYEFSGASRRRTQIETGQDNTALEKKQINIFQAVNHILIVHFFLPDGSQHLLQNLVDGHFGRIDGNRVRGLD